MEKPHLKSPDSMSEMVRTLNDEEDEAGSANDGTCLSS